MNAKMCLLVVFTAGFSLSGCKTMEGSSALAAPSAAKPIAPATRYAPRIEEDAAYIAHVESIARRRGLTLQWVNKPVKRHVDQE